MGGAVEADIDRAYEIQCFPVGGLIAKSATYTSLKDSCTENN